MANQRRLRRGVVKQLSNLSIDEISVVDRGANQHALISIAKRAPQVDDYFEDVEKFDMLNSADSKHYRQSHPLGNRLKTAYAPTHEAHQERKQNYRDTYEGHPKAAGALGLPTGHGAGPTGRMVAEHYAGGVAGGLAGAAAGHAVAGDSGALIGVTAGSLAGGAAGGAHAGKVIHNHFYGKRAPEEVGKNMDVDALFDIEKKSSFGRGGNQAVIDTFTGDDPSGVLDQPNGEEGDVGPDGTIDGVETIEGEDTPPQKKKKVRGGGDVNPTKLSGLGKSEDFWKNVVSKVLDNDEEFETNDDNEDMLSKHFPGPPGAGGFGQQQPQMGAQPMPPMMGGQMGQPPMAQSVGAQPMGMGQPTPPPGGGMPAQLPPDVIQYIQQLEQALDQLTGGGGDDSADSSDDSSSSTSTSNSADDSKKNPFGKSLETSTMDNDTFLSELAKALDEDNVDREDVSKAMEYISKAEARAKQAEEIAKAERDLRLEREFIAKAAEFNLPVRSAELGPVLKRAAESLDKEDFQTIVKCLRSVSASSDYGNPFGEVGKRGGGDNADVLSSVEAAAQDLVSKSEMTPEAATLQVLADNPRAYDEYMRDHPSRRLFQ